MNVRVGLIALLSATACESECERAKRTAFESLGATVADLSTSIEAARASCREGDAKVEALRTELGRRVAAAKKAEREAVEKVERETRERERARARRDLADMLKYAVEMRKDVDRLPEPRGCSRRGLDEDTRVCSTKVDRVQVSWVEANHNAMRFSSAIASAPLICWDVHESAKTLRPRGSAVAPRAACRIEEGPLKGYVAEWKSDRRVKLPQMGVVLSSPEFVELVGKKPRVFRDGRKLDGSPFRRKDRGGAR